MGFGAVALSDQRETRPPPDRLAIFLSKAKEPACRLRRIGDKVPDSCPMIEGSGCSFEIPFEIRLLHRMKVGTPDTEPMLLAQPRPGMWREKAVMARIAKFLQLMDPIFCFRFAICNASVN